MAFRLRQLLGCNVKVTFDEGQAIRGRIAFVGTEFVEIMALEKRTKENNCPRRKKFFIIQFDKIKMVEMIEK
ncbi:hypothetical protein BTO28_11625 [Domibacillus epiphyticus]|uniref:LSM domain-containing protein n=2 Tax=Domibacillus epiphyticus TaxID=1714355 RepID=A0A1V2A6P6_9BACI|nr:hypothetical protein BTO28_11625 [Domibacillus epiphyticus]